MNFITFIVLGIALIFAGIVVFAIVTKMSMKALAISLVVVALIVVGVIYYQKTRPVEAWIAHPNEGNDISVFEVSTGRGLYQGSSFVVHTPLTKDEVFAQFVEQYPRATVNGNEASVIIDGETLRLMFDPSDDYWQYVLEYVQ
ncbi:hypothetical protein [Timonella sp. A28]|uniref:hypothetical protein n=1 Tax=Timonella sp. A28 TaxID=3442640 RepID=UPI003EB89449